MLTVRKANYAAQL